LLAVLALCVGVASAGNSWAVIAAGSNGWGNYRHQADACHSYQIVKRNGIPDERIVMIHYDDIANNAQNPFPGKVFNKPTAAGTPGVDVYAGCTKDYTGSAATADNFIHVITGNAMGVKGGNGKVLNSTADDNVFIYFTDHGGPNIVAFPVGPYLQSSRLNQALKTMAQKNMFKKLVFYLEACESGSMFQGQLPTNINAYATTASSATESSWGTYCPPNDMVNGKHMQSCLGDLYSVVWMEDTDKMGPKESLGDQFTTVKKLTTQSACQQYGDVSFLNLPIGAFQGQINVEESSPVEDVATSASRGDVPARDIPVHLAYYQYLRADRTDLTTSHQAARSLLDQINQRINTDNTFLKIASSIVGPSNAASFLNRPAVDANECGPCCDMGHQAVFDHCGGYSEYGMGYIKIVNNLCALNSNEARFEQRLVQTIRSTCTPILTF